MACPETGTNLSPDLRSPVRGVEARWRVLSELGTKTQYSIQLMENVS